MAYAPARWVLSSWLVGTTLRLRNHNFMLCFAIVRRIVHGRPLALALGRLIAQWPLDSVGQSLEAGLAVDIGSNLQVQFVGGGEAVGDVHPNLRGVNRRARGVLHGEFR